MRCITHMSLQSLVSSLGTACLRAIIPSGTLSLNVLESECYLDDRKFLALLQACLRITNPPFWSVLKAGLKKKKSVLRQKQNCFPYTRGSLSCCPVGSWHCCGYRWEKWSPITGHCLSSVLLRLIRAQNWRKADTKAEMLQKHTDSRNGCARAVCQVKQKMLHVKKFSGRMKGLMEFKCRLLEGKKKKKRIRKARLVSYSVKQWFTALPRLVLLFCACCQMFQLLVSVLVSPDTGGLPVVLHGAKDHWGQETVAVSSLTRGKLQIQHRLWPACISPLEAPMACLCSTEDGCRLLGLL